MYNALSSILSTKVWGETCLVNLSLSPGEPQGGSAGTGTCYISLVMWLGSHVKVRGESHLLRTVLVAHEPTHASCTHTVLKNKFKGVLPIVQTKILPVFPPLLPYHLQAKGRLTPKELPTQDSTPVALTYNIKKRSPGQEPWSNEAGELAQQLGVHVLTEDPDSNLGTYSGSQPIVTQFQGPSAFFCLPGTRHACSAHTMLANIALRFILSP